MSIMLHDCFEESTPSNAITLDIVNHPAWVGNMSGLNAEKMLRSKRAFEFILRNGEHDNEYYVTFVMPEFYYQAPTFCDHFFIRRLAF